MEHHLLNLSKLSRGRGEDKGSYIEIVYDEKVFYLFIFITKKFQNFLKYFYRTLTAYITQNTFRVLKGSEM